MKMRMRLRRGYIWKPNKLRSTHPVLNTEWTNPFLPNFYFYFILFNELLNLHITHAILHIPTPRNLCLNTLHRLTLSSIHLNAHILSQCFLHISLPQFPLSLMSNFSEQFLKELCRIVRSDQWFTSQDFNHVQRKT